MFYFLHSRLPMWQSKIYWTIWLDKVYKLFQISHSNDEISFIGNHTGQGLGAPILSSASDPRLNSRSHKPSCDDDELLEQNYLHHNHYHNSIPNFYDSFCTHTLPNSKNLPKSNGDSETAETLLQLNRKGEQKNVLNHHPYGTFYYNKKNGRCGKKLNNSNVSSSRRLNNAKNLALYKRQNDSNNMATLSDEAGSASFTDLTGSNGLGRPGLHQVSSQMSMDETLVDQISQWEKCGCKRCITRAYNDAEEALNSVSKVDKISRVVFPVTFTVINIIYWYSYLKHSERIDLSFESWGADCLQTNGCFSLPGCVAFFNCFALMSYPAISKKFWIKSYYSESKILYIKDCSVKFSMVYIYSFYEFTNTQARIYQMFELFEACVLSPCYFSYLTSPDDWEICLWFSSIKILKLGRLML